jgi:histidinol-phosphatase (PHP family)
MFYAPTHGIAEGYEEGYISEVRTLAKRYEDRMKVFCGVELDFYSKFESLPYDYIIGSVHYLKIGDEYVGFDRNATTVKSVIDTYFGGDGMQYAKAYYETLARFPERRKIDVIGHFDLITKHSEKENFFDWDSPVYQEYATQAMDALIPHVKIMEINTGAIARGYRKTPYPTAFLLKEWKKRGGEIIISSDCHDQRFLTCGFAESIELAKSCGSAVALAYMEAITKKIAAGRWDDLKRTESKIMLTASPQAYLCLSTAIPENMELVDLFSALA